MRTVRTALSARRARATRPGALVALVASAALVLPLTLLAQGQEGREGRGVALQPARPTQRSLFEDTCFDADLWRARLAQLDLDLRERAFGELIQATARCNAGRRALEAWAASTAEPELAWTARLALRELRASPFRLRWEAPGSALGSDPLGPRAPDAFQDLERHLRSIEDLLGGGFDGGGGLSLHRPRQFSLPDARGMHREHRSYSVEVNPEGVRLRVIEGGGGEEREELFEAESLDELLRQHPELRDQIPGLRDMTLQPFGAGTRLEWNDAVRLRVDPQGWRARLGRELSQLGIEIDSAGERTLILGIECGRPSAEDVEACRIAPGCGVRVERVVPGTIADEIELRRGDILIELNGRQICSDEEISQVLAERPQGQALVVKIVDRGGQERVKEWKPEGER